MAATHELTILRLDDGRELAYAELGDPRGVALFGFHGTPGSHRLFRPIDANAKRLGIRLIAPDRPGYGHSSYHSGRRLLDWPRDVTALADYLGIARFGVMGISGGGPHAAVCAHQLADRLLGASIVSGIGPTLSSADSEGMMPTSRAISALARYFPPLLWPLFALLGAFQRYFGESALRGMMRQLPPPDRRVLERPEIRAMFLEEGRMAPRTGPSATLQDFTLFTRPFGFRFEDIAVPVHVWFGALDRNVPAEHGRLQADRIPNAKLHFYANEGHMLFADHADEILAASVGRESFA